jgi:hypothetical protein
MRGELFEEREGLGLFLYFEKKGGADTEIIEADGLINICKPLVIRAGAEEIAGVDGWGDVSAEGLLGATAVVDVSKGVIVRLGP